MTYSINIVSKSVLVRLLWIAVTTPITAQNSANNNIDSYYYVPQVSYMQQLAANTEASGGSNIDQQIYIADGGSGAYADLRRIQPIGPFRYVNSCLEEDEDGDGYSIYTGATAKAPYMVSLQVEHYLDYDYYEHSCGGVMIEERIVLTAAHCIDKREDMWAAIAPRCRHQEGDGRYKVIDSILHGRYNGDGYDIAILLLEDASSAYQGPFVDYKSSYAFEGSEQLTLLGWGDVNKYEANNRQYPDLYRESVRQLQRVELEYFYYYYDCYDYYIAYDQFCAVYAEGQFGELGDSCAGDSGGPLLMNFQESGASPIIVGIVSWGPDVRCKGKGHPSMYTDVSYHIDWITKKIQNIKSRN
eukprot:TRINITY_DN1555_c0_g1_i6.p1 TRINITY_DN1555_c0_g1~~TRINITY_DN1555_c0_g1_i6.p1  ORF type:complete len:376 (-),score=15.38 TRINITY_DN1555_c0_g1_i6:1170-2240(-)